jgi:uncharacterized protein with von Willebrand factor type A (vWA) domain
MLGQKLIDRMNEEELKDLQIQKERKEEQERKDKEEIGFVSDLMQQIREAAERLPNAKKVHVHNGLFRVVEGRKLSGKKRSFLCNGNGSESLFQRFDHAKFANVMAEMSDWMKDNGIEDIVATYEWDGLGYSSKSWNNFHVKPKY